jgi:hypothetical protein
MSSGSLNRNDILDSFDAAMCRGGWSKHSFSGLPQVFAKAELVTPFYGLPDIRRLKDSWYGLGGCVGVIHQEFEEIWAARDEKRAERNLFPVVLLIVNIKSLAEIAYVGADTLAADIERFVAAVTATLETMPKSEGELKAAVQKGVLCGRPIEDFSRWSQRRKFAELRRYIESLPSISWVQNSRSNRLKTRSARARSSETSPGDETKMRSLLITLHLN